MAESDIAMDDTAVDDTVMDNQASVSQEDTQMNPSQDIDITESTDATNTNTSEPQSQNSEGVDRNTKEATKSTQVHIEKMISMIPPKIEQCNKYYFYLVLLLLVDTKNSQTKDKIDYLFLFNFLKNSPTLQSLSAPEYGKKIAKLSKDEFIKPFIELKTDFNIDKMTEIYDILSANDTSKIIALFKQNINDIDLKQTMTKIIKCATELSNEAEAAITSNDEQKDNKNSSNSAPQTTTKTDDEWKGFQVGQEIDCRDTWGAWYPCVIKQHKSASDDISAATLNKSQKKRMDTLQNLEAVYVHYVGFKTAFDEWIFIENDTICDCQSQCAYTKADGETHRIAKGNTQSVYKEKKKKQENTEAIKYKIQNFEKLVAYIDAKYNAPPGSNRNGIGAKRYAMETVHGPGGNLTKFKMWDKQKKYDRLHHSHYDWWMFPNDRDSWGQGRKYALFQNDIAELLLVEGYVEDYKHGTRLVLKSWGWDMDREVFIENGTRDQQWTGYNVRLLKMLYSTIILKQWDVYRSVYKFCIGLLQKGHKFSSEPMMYEYLGLEKPSYSRRRYGW